MSANGGAAAAGSGRSRVDRPGCIGCRRAVRRAGPSSSRRSTPRARRPPGSPRRPVARAPWPPTRSSRSRRSTGWRADRRPERALGTAVAVFTALHVHPRSTPRPGRYAHRTAVRDDRAGESGARAAAVPFDDGDASWRLRRRRLSAWWQHFARARVVDAPDIDGDRHGRQVRAWRPELAWTLAGIVTGVPAPLLAPLTAVVVVQVSVRASVRHGPAAQCGGRAGRARRPGDR